MIYKLFLKNYILIDELSLDFTDGLNVITGETGSGKSILINAIDIVFGAKSTKDSIKSGADKAIIELSLKNSHDLSELFDEFGIENWGEDMVISREITHTSSRSRVNGSLVNQEFLKRLREVFLDIHSQHQTYSFLQSSYHINLLDSYSKDVYGADLNNYRNLWKKYLAVSKELENALKLNDLTENQIDFLKFQIDEIASSEILNENEDEELQNEFNILSNAEKIKEGVSSAYWILNEDETSCLNLLFQVKSNLSKISDYDENVQSIEGRLIDQIDALKSVASDLNSYASVLEYDKEKIDLIQERLYLLDKLKRKYGNTLTEVLETYNKLSVEFSMIEYSTQRIDELNTEVSALKSKLYDLALIISNKRKEVSQELADRLVFELEQLELPRSKFAISFSSSELSINGVDNVEFLLSTNVSQEPKPLIKVASGGEISRVMLAIKSIFAQNDNIDTVIFDEIDTGISGKTSVSVAEKIENLSKFRQIILITHQPIIASKAKNHIYVSKIQNDTTQISFNVLSEDEKIEALAKLASGDITQKSLEFARSLVE